MIGGVCAAGGAIAIGAGREGLRCRVEERGVRVRRRRSSRCAMAMLGFWRGFMRGSRLSLSLSISFFFFLPSFQ